MAWILTSNNFDVVLAYSLTDISLTSFSDSSNYALITYVDTQDTTYDEPCIHDNVAGEFNALAAASEKVSLNDSDWFIIEDSDDAWAKKVVSVANLPTGGDSMPADPGADRILIWDDSASNWVWATPNTGLAISGTDVNVDVSDTNFFLDEDDMVSDSATKVASQQSIKAYVDSATATAGWTEEAVVVTSGASNYCVSSGFDSTVVNVIHVNLIAVSLSLANCPPVIQFGTATGYVISGYYSGITDSAVDTTDTTGFIFARSALWDAADAGYVGFTATRGDDSGYSWTVRWGSSDLPQGRGWAGGGGITLPSPLTCIRVLCMLTGATFDGGTAKVIYM